MAKPQLVLFVFCVKLALQPAIALPNILFIMSDQHRFDAIGDGAHTPHLDSLAADGAQFMTHYSSTPSCTPARSAILTGRSPWNHGMLGYAETVASAYQFEMPKQMAAAGLSPAIIGKSHYGWDNKEDKPIPHGFKHLQIYDGIGSGLPNGREYDHYDRWFQKQLPGKDPLMSGGLGWNTWRGGVYEYEEWLHPTAWTGNLALDKLADLAANNESFFLKISFHRPHSPYDPPRRILNATKPPKRPPAVSDDGWDTRFRQCFTQHAADTCCGEVDKDAHEFSRRAYLASISFVDEQIGMILDSLKKHRLMQNTVILYTSDHGDMRGDHFLWRKGLPYEGSSRVPMIMWWPDSLNSSFGKERGIKVDAVTELRDLLPTFLDIVGQWNDTCEDSFDGRPLTWLLRGHSTPWRQWIDMEHNIYCKSFGSWNALTDGKIKFIYHAWLGEESLFNLTSDPEENHNLASNKSYSETLKLWRARMIFQFEQEGRGRSWTHHGKLMPRPYPINFNRNYPKVHTDASKAETSKGEASLSAKLIARFWRKTYLPDESDNKFWDNATQSIGLALCHVDSDNAACKSQ